MTTINAPTVTNQTPLVLIGNTTTARVQHWNQCLARGQPFLMRWKMRTQWWGVEWSTQPMLGNARILDFSRVDPTPDACARIRAASRRALEHGSRRAEAQSFGHHHGRVLRISEGHALRLCADLLLILSDPASFAPEWHVPAREGTWDARAALRFDWAQERGGGEEPR